MLAAILQSPKGAEMFPIRRAAVVAQPVMTITSSNAYTHFIAVWSSVSNAASYKLYYGTNTNSYSFSTVTTKTNASTILLQQNVTYYFSVTATGTNGLESDHSNVLFDKLPISFNTITLKWNPTNSAIVQSSTNLIQWKSIATNASPYTKVRDKKQEFFRLR